MMSALISDVISGRISPGVCNAAVNASGKFLNVVKMQHQYGRTNGGDVKELVLIQDDKKAK